MMRASSFGGSLLYAAIAGLGSIAWMIAANPVVGPTRALGLYSLAAAVLYLVWIAPSWSRGFLAGTFTGIPALALAVLAPMAVGGVLGAAFVLAAARSGFLFNSQPARACAVEAVLVGGGLLLGRALADASLLSLGLGFWGFFLVQSVFFLIGGIGERSEEEPETDAFDKARRQAVALMEEGPWGV